MDEKLLLSDADSHSGVDDMWAKLVVSVEAPQPASLALVEGLGRVYANGRSEFASFLLGPATAVAAIAQPPEPQAFWRQLLLLPDVVSALQPPSTSADWLADITFDALPAEALAGDLIATMTAGGAYRRSTAMQLADARRLAASFCEGQVNGRAVSICKTRQSWSNWFNRALWDRTWLGFDGALNRFWVLRATDVD